ncbi:Transmembrane protein 260-like [Hondaea fermentalgiana]|uniref:Transmembrane protein 260-like n=1 Tax=Hondaea fermentalgiana TaxID=2315210 RepID=A0A2R5GEP7_9STRA|nr:Transmembrane protein 260-like [Hondaea fermentalgiana]|eukprot:GBG29410.1 Transmembrane protein 260-like [Hondaea fermentalgiana]
MGARRRGRGPVAQVNGENATLKGRANVRAGRGEGTGGPSRATRATEDSSMTENFKALDDEDHCREAPCSTMERFVLWTVTFAVALGVQWPFIYDDVPGGDSGEILAEACVLGVAHPPGYPAFVLLWHAFMNAMSQALSPARAASLCSVLCGAGASGFVALTVYVFPCLPRSAPEKGDKILEAASGFLAGIAFTTSPLVWTYTVGAEVFPLNNLLCGAILYLTISIARGTSDTTSAQGIESCESRIILGATLSGLALSNQHTSVLFLVVLVPYVVLSLSPRPLSFERLTKFGFAGLLGLLPYAHVYMAGRTPQAGSWGATDSLAGLWRHFSRAEYGTLTLSGHAGPSENFMERTMAYFEDLVTEELGALFLVGPCIALAGLGLSLSSTPGKVLAAAYTFYFGIFHSLANLPLSLPMPREVHRRFWIQPHLIVCIWLGLGVAYATLRLYHLGGRRRGPLLALLATASLTLIMRQLDLAEQTPTDVVGLYADAALASLPEGALVGSHTDINWNSIRFKQACAGRRPDVTHVSFQMMPYKWFNMKQAPLYPDVVFPVLPSRMSTSRGSEANAKMIVDFAIVNAGRHSGGVYFAALSILWDAVYQRALFLLSAALQRGPESLCYAPALEESTALLDDVVKGAGSAGTISVSLADVVKNAALASIRWVQYVATNRQQDAVRAEAIALRCLRAFRQLGDHSDPVYPRFISVLKALEAAHRADS